MTPPRRHHVPAPRGLGPATLAWMAALALLAACSSKPPPPSLPQAAVEAEKLARQAARLQALENWTGAAETWRRAAGQYRLLHREADTALAEHNEALARRALGQTDAAFLLLETAAAANQGLSLTNAWWRNQIALLQLELEDGPARAQSRLASLLPRLGEIRTQPGLAALLHHEEARIRLSQRQPVEALAALERAKGAFGSLHDEHGLAAVSLTRARILRAQSPSLSVPAWRDALSRFEKVAYPRGVALALAGLGSALAESPAASDRQQARVILSQAVENLKTLRLTADANAAEGVLSRLSLPNGTELP